MEMKLSDGEKLSFYSIKMTNLSGTLAVRKSTDFMLTK